MWLAPSSKRTMAERDLLRVDGVPVGLDIGPEIVPAFRSGGQGPALIEEGSSIIVVLATDAPLLPVQCQRLARRATTGLAWVGGLGANGSGDIFIAFSTANHVGQNDKVAHVRMINPDAMTKLFRRRRRGDRGGDPQCPVHGKDHGRQRWSPQSCPAPRSPPVTSCGAIDRHVHL